MSFGKYSILVLMFILIIVVPSCKNDDVTGPITVGETDTFLLVESGNNQKGNTSERLKDSVVVRIMNSNHKPIAGAEIIFSVISGEGSISNSTVRSNSSGKASVTWTLGVGPEQILKVYLSNNTAVAPQYLYANSNLVINTKWITGYNFVAYDKTYTHDNRILESNHFLTFSDAASDDAKIIYSKMAEESVYELKQLLNIQSDAELGINTDNAASKLKILTTKTANYEQLAYNLGFVLYGHDSPQFQSWRNGDFWFRREIKHETMHVIHFKFGLDPPGGPYTDTWFTEGIAEFVSGGAFTPITNLEEWNTWINTPGNINPIKIHSWYNFPNQNRAGYYYNAFGLAVRYLFDSKGLGKTLNDATAMMKEVKSLGSFRTAFQKHMGITVDYFEENFNELITEFLKKQ